MDRMPVLFIGHGSPMNALADNAYTQWLGSLGKELPRPKAILCISAHWLTVGTFITSAKNPKTIHDFGGFPQPLFAIQYPAPGSLDTVKAVQELIQDPLIVSDDEWGFDHGSWSVLRHMYPNADIPLVQLSIDSNQPPEYHYKLGKQLARLRDQGILILGSGNIVHNLGQIRWQSDAPACDWAVEFDSWIKAKLEKRDFSAILSESLGTAAGRLSIPTPDHFYPLLYVLGASDTKDNLIFEYEEIQNASISMLSISFGRNLPAASSA